MHAIGRLFVFLIVVFGILGSERVVSAVSLEPAFPNLAFIRPVDLQHAGDESGRLFVAEQKGTIIVFDNDSETTSSTVFLDITDRVDAEGGEKGLLGFSFHPDFSENGYFFVSYTAANPFRSVISRFSISDNPDEANPDSEVVLIELEQQYVNHNSGQLAFGPDGYLYIGFGDGGGSGDPNGHGQNPATLEGSILRIDVDDPQAPAQYGIPADNPFAGNDQGYREEIYAYGLRNPWRFSFDTVTGLLWAGDVGQNAYEEIDIIVNGGNYGWNIMEGTSCYESEDCDPSGLILPIAEYGRDDGNAVIGGYVYRGSRVPSLKGTYIYGDYISGNIWAIRYENSEVIENELLLDSGFNIPSFGIDEDQELYILSISGTIHRFVAEPVIVDSSGDTPAAYMTAASFPNPFNGSTTLSFTLPTGQDIAVSVYNIAGQKVAEVAQGYFAKGAHMVRWAPGGLAGGVYFLRIASPKGGVTTKVVYIP